jgi:hypothetical protein
MAKSQSGPGASFSVCGCVQPGGNAMMYASSNSAIRQRTTNRDNVVAKESPQAKVICKSEQFPDLQLSDESAEQATALWFTTLATKYASRK